MVFVGVLVGAGVVGIAVGAAQGVAASLWNALIAVVASRPDTQLVWYYARRSAPCIRKRAPDRTEPVPLDEYRLARRQAGQQSRVAVLRTRCRQRGANDHSPKVFRPVAKHACEIIVPHMTDVWPSATEEHELRWEAWARGYAVAHAPACHAGGGC